MLLDKLCNLTKITFHFVDSSTPPEYHRSYSIVATPTGVDLKISCYGSILLHREYGFDSYRFGEFLSALEAYKINDDGDGFTDTRCGGCGHRFAFEGNGFCIEGHSFWEFPEPSYGQDIPKSIISWDDSLYECDRTPRPVVFGEDSFKNMAGFVAKIRNAEDDMSVFLRGKFKPQIREELEKVDLGTPIPKDLAQSLVKELNAVLEGDLILSAERFHDLGFGPMFSNYIGSFDVFEEAEFRSFIINMNRLLIDHFYPDEIVTRFPCVARDFPFVSKKDCADDSSRPYEFEALHGSFTGNVSGLIANFRALIPNLDELINGTMNPTPLWPDESDFIENILKNEKPS